MRASTRVDERGGDKIGVFGVIFLSVSHSGLSHTPVLLQKLILVPLTNM